MTEPETFASRDGLKIAFRSWVPQGPPRAIVVLNHGLNSHGGQYGWAAQQLTDAGMLVFAIDMRGRGLSEGRRFTVEDIGEYVGDLHQLILLAKQRHPGCATFLLGHSVGGVVACSYALDHAEELAGLICESFAFEVPAPSLALAAFKLLAPLLPNLPVIRLKHGDFSRDPAAVAALDADPLTRNEAQPLRTAAALVRAQERLRRSFGQIRLPVLILHGTADKATLPSGSRFFLDNAGSADKTLTLYDGHYHDLLNDLGKDKVIAEIIGWIQARLSHPAARS